MQIGVTTISNVISGVDSGQPIASPPKKRPRVCPVTDVDEFVLSNIRQVIYDLHQTGPNPSLEDMLAEIRKRGIEFHGSRTSLWKVVKELGFKYKKMNNRLVLLEKPDIVAWRIRFLRRMHENAFSDKPRPVVYLDGTWIFLYGTSGRPTFTNLFFFSHPVSYTIPAILLDQNYADSW